MERVLKNNQEEKKIVVIDGLPEAWEMSELLEFINKRVEVKILDVTKGTKRAKVQVYKKDVREDIHFNFAKSG